MKILIRFLLSIFLATGIMPAFCQVIDATIYDTTIHAPITKYSYFLRTTQPIAIDSVMRSQTGFIKAANKPVLIFNYDPYYYWFRFIVNNPQDKNVNLMLLMAPVGMYDGRLFQKINGKWSQVAHTGLRYRFEDRSYQFTHHVFPFTLPKKSIDTLYLSIDASNVYKSFGFALLQPKQLKIFENKIYFVFGIIEGLLILFFMLNFSLFFALKEKLHLWYALYIAMLFMIVMKNDHLDQQFLGMDSEMAFRLTPYMAIGALAIAVLMHVVQNFLKKTLIQNKLLYRLSIFLKINVICSAIAHAFVFLMVFDYRIQSIVFSWAKISTLLGICIIIINCIYCITKGFKGALFLFCGSLVFMIGSAQRLFFPSTLSFLFPPTTFHIGIIVETFVVSAGLIYRYWFERKLQRQKEEEIQTQTMHDISQEIHDNISQELALAKLHLNTIEFTNEKKVLEKVDAAKKIINRVNNDLRNLSRTLKNEPAEGEGLAKRIEEKCLEMGKTGVFKIVFTPTGYALELENKKQASIIRIMQEVLQNASKHSQASKVAVSLNYKADVVELKIVDDGIGFDLALAELKSNGLQNIKKRCLLLNAIFHLKSEVGCGTEILINIPASGYSQKGNNIQH